MVYQSVLAFINSPLGSVCLLKLLWWHRDIQRHKLLNKSVLFIIPLDFILLKVNLFILDFFLRLFILDIGETKCEYLF